MRTVCQIDYTNNINQLVQLFGDLLDNMIRPNRYNCHSGKRAIFGRGDGQGFDISSVARGHGLENVNRRTEELDGSVTIESVPGEGTSVTVTLPA